jgi:rRNA-processing protein FCF1
MALDRVRPDKELRTVLLDTNALLMPFQFNINLDLELERLFGRVRVVVLSPVRDEVYGLAQGGNKHAKTALKLLEKYAQLDWEGKGDDAIVDYAKKNPDCIVLTNDKQLRSRLSEIGIKRIMLYKKKYLDWDVE